MSQHIEIELKNLLTAEEFSRAADFFQIPRHMFTKQVNHYFDTPAFSLKEQGAALRIRQKDAAFELTLKQPAKEGLLETNQIITEPAASRMIATGSIPGGQVENLVRDMLGRTKEIDYFGSLTTERAELHYQQGLLVLDHSYYLNTEDYELEYEVQDFDSGQKDFLELLNKLQIPVRKTDNKIKRFYQQKYSRLYE